MPTYKTRNPDIIAAYQKYHDDQKVMAAYFDEQATTFPGMTGGVVTHIPFDRTWFAGFSSDNDAAVNKDIWRDAASKHHPARWWIRSGVPRGRSTPATLKLLRDTKAQWDRMLKGGPVADPLTAEGYLSAMGFGNWLCFLVHRPVQLFLWKDVMYLSLGSTPEKWDKDRAGWEEILGSEYNVALKELELNNAEKRHHGQD